MTGVKVKVLSALKNKEAAGSGDGGRTLLDSLKSKIKILEKKKKKQSPGSSNSKVCPKVPQSLQSDIVKGADNYYEPKIISWGPYHHGKPHLSQGETLKLQLAAIYILDILDKQQGSDALSLVDDIHKKITRNAKELRGCYNAKFMAKKYSTDDEEEKFVQMMMVDGCALLSYIDFFYYSLYSPGIKYQDLRRIHKDLFLLENQLPYEQLLLPLMWNSGSSERRTERTEWWKWEEFFGTRGGRLRNLSGHHILDLYRSILLGDDNSCPTMRSALDHETRVSISDDDQKDQTLASFRNVKELMAVGIRIRRSPSPHLRDVSFASSGILPLGVAASLKLPPITIDKSSYALFSNLVAYEMSSKVDQYFIAYLRLLDCLIDNVDDVKELQSAGVLQNNLGTHQEAADFFNTISTNLQSHAHDYWEVKVGIGIHLKSHYSSKRNMWMTQCLDTYLGTPWAIIAWVAAAIALLLTAVQTYFAVFPRSG